MFTFIRIALNVIVALFSLLSYGVFHAILINASRYERIFFSLFFCLALYVVSIWLLEDVLTWRPDRKPLQTLQAFVSLASVAAVFFINLLLGYKLYKGDALTPSETGYAQGVAILAFVLAIVLRFAFILDLVKPKKPKE